MTTEILLHARHLSRRYGGRTALDRVDIMVSRGEVVGLLGPNGAGKSTTLRILSGTMPPHQGTVEIAGIDLFNKPRVAKRFLGYLPENPPLYADMTVESYLTYCGNLRGLRRQALTQALARTLERCQLRDVRQRLIGHLSKGYQQRVGIAQAVIHDPQVLILDEPTVGLDPLQIREIRALIDELRANRAIVLSSHILPEIQALCDRVLILREGRQVFDGPVATAGSTRVRLRCAQRPDPACLGSIDGVTAVRALSETSLGLELRDAAAAAQVQQLVLDAGWGLQEWAPAESGLEQLFVSLVHGEGLLEESA